MALADAPRACRNRPPMSVVMVGASAQTTAEDVDGQPKEEGRKTSLLVGDGAVGDLAEGNADHEHGEGKLCCTGTYVRVAGNGWQSW